MEAFPPLLRRQIRSITAEKCYSEIFLENLVQQASKEGQRIGDGPTQSKTESMKLIRIIFGIAILPVVTTEAEVE